MLQTQVLQKISRTFDVSMHWLHMCPVNQALWGTFMNSCVWATVYLSKDEEDLKRDIQNMEVRKIETFFETVQAQSSNLKNRDHEIHGLEETVVWTSGNWRHYSLLDQRIVSQFTSKSVCAQQDGSVSWRKRSRTS